MAINKFHISILMRSPFRMTKGV